MIRYKLTDSDRVKIRSLLLGGLSQKSVVNCMRNDHHVKVTHHSVRLVARSLEKPHKPPVYVVSPGFTQVPQFRCPGCGGLSVFEPCQKCTVLWKMETSENPLPPPALNENLVL